MVQISVDTSDFRRLHADLKKFRESALPHALKDSLNTCAFELQKTWRSEVSREFTLRNDFTERSIRVDKATGINVRSMHSVTGSVASFMLDQEQGAVAHGQGKHKAIPAPGAGGQAAGAGKRTNLIRARYRVGAINVGHPSLAKYGRRRQNAVVMAIAIRKGERFALLNRSKGGKGLFEVRGTKRAGKQHAGGKTKLIWDLSKGSVVVHPTHLMARANAANSAKYQKITEASLLYQLKRAKVFGY